MMSLDYCTSCNDWEHVGKDKLCGFCKIYSKIFGR